MVHSPPTRKVSLLAFLLCSTIGAHAQAKQESVSLNTPPPTEKSQKLLAANAQNYMQRANTQPQTKSVDYKLSAAELLLRSKDLDKAKQLLDTIPDNQLKPNQKNQKALLLGHVYLFKKQPKLALAQINTVEPDLLKRDESLTYYLLQAETFENLQEHLDAARARMNLNLFLTERNNVRKNQFEISRLLTKVPLNQLTHASQRGNALEKGWYELAFLKQRYSYNRMQIKRAMNDWIRAYPYHPGRVTIPEHLLSSSQQSVTIDSPKNIALLLPLSGSHKNAAKAIQEGFLASYYESQGDKPNIRVYDTEQVQNIQNLYQQAVSEGADFVVGPLSKNNVYDLNQMPRYQIRTPIIALNNHPDIKNTAPEFFQFALSPESEAEQLAERAWQNDYRLASIVVPDNNWGKRTASAFQSHWELLGGSVSQVTYIGSQEDQANHVRQLLNIDQSQDRANKVRKLIREKVEFQPRRRHDLDVIVLAAPPEQARQLKPLLEFYYANEIPVYATSSIYHGKPNAKKDRDINGIIFCDMPGIIDPQQSQILSELLAKYGQTQGDQYARLFAMGVDAYNLTQSLQELKNDPRANLQGTTGKLSITPNNVVKRELSFAQFKSGIAQEL